MQDSLERALYEALAETDEGLTALRQLTKGRQPRGQAARAYNRALAETLSKSPRPADTWEALSSLSALAKMRPRSDFQLLHRRPEEWHQAMAAWTEAVQRAIHGPLRPFRDLFAPGLLAEARWFEALSSPARVSNGSLALVREGGKPRWELQTADGEPVGFPLFWGRLSPQGCKLTSSSEEVSGAAVTSVTVAYQRRGQILRAAACECVAGVWSRWRVADRPQEAEVLARYGARVFHGPGVARLGHILVEARVWPVIERLLRPVTFDWARRVLANGLPLPMAGQSDGQELVFLPLEGELELAHPDHYVLRLAPQPGQAGWTLRSLPGVTYPYPREGEAD